MLKLKLSVEITPGADKVSAEAIADLLYKMSKAMRSEYFSVLQESPQVRTVLLSVSIIDTLTYSILVGELVTTPHQTGSE